MRVRDPATSARPDADEIEELTLPGAPQLALFYGVRFSSNAAQGIFFAALFIIAGTGDSAPIEVSGSVAAMIAGGLLFGLPGGSVVDRLGAVRGLVLGSALRVLVVVAGLTVVLPLGGIWALAFLYSAASQVYSPAELALVRSLQHRRPGGTHALLFALQHLGQASGLLVVGPLLYVAGGPGLALGGSAAAFAAVAIAAVVLWRLVERGEPLSSGTPARLAFDLSATLEFFVRRPHAAYAASQLAFTEMASKAAAVAAPFYIHDALELHGSEAMMPGAAVVGGVLVGLWSAGRPGVPVPSQRDLRRVLVGMVALCVLLATIGEGPGPLSLTEPFVDGTTLSVVIAVPLAMLLAFFASAGVVGGRAVLTMSAPHSQQARVFAAQGLLGSLLAILPLVFAGISTEYVGPRTAFLIIGMAGCLVWLVLEVFAVSGAPGSRLARLRVEPLAAE